MTDFTTHRRNPPVNPLVVEVTEQDIVNGERGNPFGCPVSIAAQRVVGECGVTPYRLVLRQPQGVTYQTPPDAAQWIRAFDRRQPVAPATFTFGTVR